MVEMIECPSDEYRLHEPPCPERGPISHAPSLYGPGATPVLVATLVGGASLLGY